jgi:uncharacterized membrane protein YfcA
LDADLLIAAGAIAVLVGVLIGMIGIGGVLLVPVLTQALAVPVVPAISAAMLAYLFSGAAGTIAHARHRHIDWRSAGVLTASAAPTAFGGTVLVAQFGGDWLLVLVSLTLILSGAHRLIFRSPPDRSGAGPAPLLAAAGGLTGLGSAMSGTGGPVMLLPMLLALRFPVLPAIGLSQVIQLPVAGAATLANAMSGVVVPSLGVTLGIGLAAGTVLGARLVRLLPVALIARLVSMGLMGGGVLLLARSLLR